MPCLVTAVTAYFVGQGFLQTFEIAVSTLLLCYCEVLLLWCCCITIALRPRCQCTLTSLPRTHTSPPPPAPRRQDVKAEPYFMSDGLKKAIESCRDRAMGKPQDEDSGGVMGRVRGLRGSYRGASTTEDSDRV